ncbi:unnamed protein product, partial [Didymodactylos carnosus]
DFHTLREEASNNINEVTEQQEQQEQQQEQLVITSSEGEQTLRHRHPLQSDEQQRLTESYDMLEQDLQTLKETFNEVALLVQKQKYSVDNTQNILNTATARIKSASSLLHKAVQNRYVTIASGACLGSLVGGPVGFMAGIKIGALAAMTGSALGALSVNLIRKRYVSEQNNSMNESQAYDQAML